MDATASRPPDQGYSKLHFIPEFAINDTPEIAHNLFVMMNLIVEERISRPKHIQSLYDKLPDGARKAIEKRDGAEG